MKNVSPKVLIVSVLFPYFRNFPTPSSPFDWRGVSNSAEKPSSACNTQNKLESSTVSLLMIMCTVYWFFSVLQPCVYLVCIAHRGSALAKYIFVKH